MDNRPFLTQSQRDQLRNAHLDYFVDSRSEPTAEERAIMQKAKEEYDLKYGKKG